jgi:hypothetical protein
MGSLIALPCDNAPESNICGLTADNIAAPSERVPDGCDSAPGLKTAVARKLFKAFQDWGAYVADNGDPPAIDVEGGNGDGVPDGVLTAYGINMIASYSDTGATHDYYCDWWRIWVNLALVSNNDSTHVGGSAAQSGTSGADNFHHDPTPANDIKRPAPLGN